MRHHATIIKLTVAAILGLRIAAAEAADPLPSWRDGAVKTAIENFVARVTTEAGADFVSFQQWEMPMETRMAALELRLAEVEQHLEAAERRLAVAGQRFGRGRLFGRVAVLSAVAAIFGLMPVGNSHAWTPGGVPGLDDRLTAVEEMVLASDSALAALEAKTAPLSVDEDDFFITGKNVHIRDGSGSTNGGTGLGNLTIGYNEPGNFRGDDRTGTHNLVLGSLNNYAGFGGLVAGTNNHISGDFATVVAGAANTASGPGSSVTAGGANVASGLFSSVSGGENNTASGSFSSVSGGNARTSAGPHDWRGGGLFQTN